MQNLQMTNQFEKGRLFVALTGQLSEGDFREFRGELRDQLKQHELDSETQSAIIDLRGADGGLETMEIYRLGISHAEVVPPTQPVAFLYNADKIEPSQITFAEAVHCNHGGNVAFFTEIADAEKWLDAQCAHRAANQVCL